MSEWGIEQPSTFGRLGGYVVEAFVWGCGITAALAVWYLTRTEHTTVDAPSPKIEESVVKQDTIPRDTIMFTLAKKQKN